MKNVIKGLLIVLAFSSPMAISLPAVHAETTSTTKTSALTKTSNNKIHHKVAINDSKTNLKSNKTTHKKHLKHYKHHKHISANLANKSTTPANKAHK